MLRSAFASSPLVKESSSTMSLYAHVDLFANLFALFLQLFVTDKLLSSGGVRVCGIAGNQFWISEFFKKKKNHSKKIKIITQTNLYKNIKHLFLY